jgi:hypothetical protein
MATGTRSPDVLLRYGDENGRPLDQGSLTTYVAGTTSLTATFQDQATATANANPLPLPHGKPAIWPLRLGVGQSYKYFLFDALGGPIATQDTIEAVPITQVNAAVFVTVSAADFSTTSTTWINFTGLTATITTRGGAILARASFPGYVSTGAQAIFQFVLDGGGQGIGGTASNTDLQQIPLLWNLPQQPGTPPAAGAHTVNVQVMMGVAGTFTSPLATQAAGSLSLLEVNV